LSQNDLKYDFVNTLASRPTDRFALLIRVPHVKQTTSSGCTKLLLKMHRVSLLLLLHISPHHLTQPPSCSAREKNTFLGAKLQAGKNV
jgi:hypothetical protein